MPKRLPIHARRAGGRVSDEGPISRAFDGELTRHFTAPDTVCSHREFARTANTRVGKIMGDSGNSTMAWVGVLEQSTASRLLRDAPLLMDVLTILHLLAVGIMLVVFLALDTRLLRSMHTPLRLDLSTPLTIAAVALAVVLATGGVLFAADPSPCLGSPWFPLKLVLLLGMALNAVWMYRSVHRELRQRQPLPPRLRTAAMASLTGWFLLVMVSVLPPG